MLSLTLKVLERDGLVRRRVIPSVPPQLENEFSDPGRELLQPVKALAEWTAANTPRIMAARATYDSPLRRPCRRLTQRCGRAGISTLVSPVEPTTHAARRLPASVAP